MKTLFHSFVLRLALVAGGLLLAAGFAGAGIITVVNTNISGAGSLRQAVLDAAAGDSIVFHTGLNGGTITLGGSHIVLNKNVTINASSLAAGITISGNSDGDFTLEGGESRIFDIPAGPTVVLRRLRLINGIANPASATSDRFGGAIRSNGQLTMEQCTVSRCHAHMGGGLATIGGSSTLTQCTFSDNFAAAADGGSPISIIGGGGIYNSSMLTLTQCTLSGNSASAVGNLLTINGGGGIYNEGTLTLTQSTLSRNSALRGGGIYNVGLLLTLTHSTLSGNSAANQGGGIYNFGPLTLANSIVDNNLVGTSLFNLTAMDIYNTSTITRVGANFVQVLINAQSGSDSGPAVIGADPLLAPLGYYGGPTRTMPPRPGSLAIDGAVGSVEMVDQRGAPRPVDGDGNSSTIADIGAAEYLPPIVVTNTQDSGPGSLRAAIALHPFTSAAITFAPVLNGGTITLTTGHLTLNGSVTIDASSLPNGITINANRQSRVMEIQRNSTVALHRLTLTGGVATGDFPANSGGAIFAHGDDSGNAVSLSLFSCTLSGNSASRGGGIYSFGSSGSATLSLTSCTLSGNSANFGGGIFSDGQSNGSATLSLSSCTLSGNSAGSGGGILSAGYSGSATLNLTSCTLSGNSASSRGGGIYNEGYSGSATLNLTSCTLSGNSASSQGGGIYSEGGEGGSADVSLNNTILAENTAPDGPDQRVIVTTTTATGKNLMSSTAGSNIGAPALANINVLGTTPLLLAPLGHYGGPTMTRPPLSGSPAIDSAGTTNPGGTDQRGFPRFVDGNAASAGAQLDIGAVEFQGVTGEFNISFDLDSDRDGTPNGVEYAIGTNPFLADANNSRHFRLTSFTNGRPNFTFGLDISRQSTIILRLIRSTDLINFNQVITTNASTNFLDPGINLLQFDDPSAPAGKAFYRLQALRRP